MRKSRFSESQILAILGGAKRGWCWRRCAASTASTRRLTTNGRASARGCRPARSGGSKNSRRRAPGSRRCTPDRPLENAAIKDVLSRKLRRRSPGEPQCRSCSRNAICRACAPAEPWAYRGWRSTNPRRTGRPRTPPSSTRSMQCWRSDRVEASGSGSNDCATTGMVGTTSGCIACTAQRTWTSSARCAGGCSPGSDSRSRSVWSSTASEPWTSCATRSTMGVHSGP